MPIFQRSSVHLGKKPFMQLVAEGQVPGHSTVNKFGHSGSIPTTGGAIWAKNGAYDFFPTTAQAMKAASSSTISGGEGGFDLLLVDID